MEELQIDKEGLLSHPKKLLIDHLSVVAVIARATVEEKGYRFVVKETEITNRQLSDLVWIAAISHDIAKATGYFQNYIRNPEEIHSNLKNHSLLSSVFAYFVASRYCEREFKDKLLQEFLPILVLIAVKRHHGNIQNLQKEILFSNEDIEYLSEQIKSIHAPSVELILSSLCDHGPIKITWRAFTEYWELASFQQRLKDFRLYFKLNYPKLDEKTQVELFNLFQVIYSALMYSDKNDVILKDVNTTNTTTDITGCLNRYREKNGFNIPVSEINRIKNEAYFGTLEHLERVFTRDQHLYSITLPTGLGKTLTAFSVADKIRSLTGNINAKVTIVIPYTSIIDQIFEVYREVLETDSSEFLLKHHHLSEPRYKDSSEKVYEENQSQFLIETWQSETIVTTFVQFLETILSMDKTKLMKLVNLRNAVILLDEIQTIPYELWETVRKTFLSLGETLNIYFILISATQPLIFAPRVDIVELVPDHRKYFKVFNRTRLVYHKDKISFEDFIDIISDYIYNEPKKDVLIILNIKKAARRCFEELTKQEQEILDNVQYFFLSTLITPHERKEIIQKIKKRSHKRKIIVSTQLIEAGVDISVDTIFRQLSPIDSIIQSAGRANRYNEKEQVSDIFLYDIDDEHGKATSRIYGSDLMLKTRNTLSDIEVMEERDYLDLIDRYYEEVRKQSDETSSDLLDAIRDLRFMEIDLKLIQERKTESVFIQLNEEAKYVWERYVSLYDEELTPWERKTKFASFKSLFYDYVINVPVPYGETKINFDSEQVHGFYLSSLEQPSAFYSYSANDTRENIGYDTNKTSITI